MRYGLLLLIPIAAAQSGAPWGSLPELAELRLLDARPYRHGELIRADFKFAGRGEPGQPPPDELWSFTGLLLDPPADCGTIAKPCQSQRAQIIGGLFVPQDRQPLALNSYLPPGLTGRYRIALLSRKQVRITRDGFGTTYGFAEPAQYAVSKTVEIEVIAASPEWLAQTIAKSRSVLNGLQPKTEDEQRARQEAAEQLAWLNQAAGWNASLDRLGQETEGVLLRGLAAGEPAEQVCDLMQARVSAPAQSVSGAYLWTLTEVCVRAHLPPAPAAATGTRPMVIVGQLGAGPFFNPSAQPMPQEMRDWSAKHNAYVDDIRAKATAALAGSLSRKESAVRGTALITLLEYVRQRHADQRAQPDPSWIALLTPEFVREFQSADPGRKSYLLDLYTSTVDSPDVIPLLESVLAAWKPGDSYESAHSALRALNALSPQRARARILAELTKPVTWLDPGSLDLLPASAVPPMDDTLIAAMSRDQQPGGWHLQLPMAAVARYATSEALPRIRSIYESSQDSCQPELMAYFVRIDPAYAERVFRSHPWDMHVAPPRCTVQYFTRTSPLAMNASLAEYLSAYLMHSDVYVKTTAAQMLRRYGPPRVLPKLWDTFRYFHEYWKGKGMELEGNGQSILLEVELRNAIARGRNWVATDSDLRTIQSLCSSKWCLGETQHDLELWANPLSIEIVDQQSGVRGRIAQYDGIESVAAMKEKLAQFPQGTRFSMHVMGGKAAKAAVEIRQFAAEKGVAVE
jgi:hypothetical protein